MTDLVSLTGATQRQIRYWRALGLLPPPKGGRGTHARWTDQHVRAIQRVKDEFLDSPARRLRDYAEYRAIEREREA